MFLALMLIAGGLGLVAPPSRVAPRTRVDMGFMDGFKKAFENEQFDAKPSAGLSGTKAPIEVVICGKKSQGLPGQRMKDLVRSARAPIKFNCENGECGTCECLVNGRKVRVCMAKVPAKGPVEVKLK
ncbi:hypothetical protein CTAYLR_005542 [Chrysophaeum taylorii]|uniref:2Fe-2S ferredoxin-type domain-containing protein n=1 Tax=Chrysophaeum taylorii TaxID=2483200 RepID=A0AAD7U5N2_9STRA|nr:hypothetical protein CTAYLR_005542 [Chrysophaeum taylorii]